MITLFLDTEWADLAGTQLVSLALVSENGKHRFYAELDPLPEQPTDFVRAVVYPLLDRGDAALTAPEFTRRLRAFFVSLGDDCTILFDYGLDGGFLRSALEGFDRLDAQEISASGIVLDVQVRRLIHLGDPNLPTGTRRIDVRTELIQDALVNHKVERYFAHRPALALRRHHAAVDAEALRRGYLAARWGIPVETST